MLCNKAALLSSVMDDSEPLPTHINTTTTTRNTATTTSTAGPHFCSEYEECEEEYQGQELTDFDLIQSKSKMVQTNSNHNHNTDSSSSSILDHSTVVVRSIYYNDDEDDLDDDDESSSTSSSSSFHDFVTSPFSSPLSHPKSFSHSLNPPPIHYHHPKEDHHQQQQQYSKQRQKFPIYILGRHYNSTYNSSFQLDQGSLFWFTYRRDFPELMPYKMTTDAGWGCMLRASQMLLAQALRVHFKGRGWRPSSIRHDRRPLPYQEDITVGSASASSSAGMSASSTNSTNSKMSSNTGGNTSQHDAFTTFIANAFADYPGPCFPFSLPNMVASGLRYDKLPGEWYGPGTVAYVLRDLVLIYQKLQGQTINMYGNKEEEGNHSLEKDIFKVMVAQEGCVYKDSVEEFMTQEGLISSTSTNVTATTQKQTKPSQSSSSSPPSSPSPKEPPHPLHPLQTPPQTPTPKLSPVDDDDDSSDKPSAPLLQWDTALLLLVPVRLGLQKFNTDYSEALADFFSLPQCVGMLGGTPRHAIWFYGSVRTGYHTTNPNANDKPTRSVSPFSSQSSSNNHTNQSKKAEWKLYGLDPHTVQPTPPLHPSSFIKSSPQLQRTRKRIIMSDKNMSSLHPSSYYNPNNTHSTKPVCMDIKNIDPSLALAFYCRDRDDFELLVQSLTPPTSSPPPSSSSKGTQPPRPKRLSLFSILENKPDYNAHMSLLVEDDHDDSEDDEQFQMSSGSGGGNDIGDGEKRTKKKHSDCEEDEYIFL